MPGALGRRLKGLVQGMAAMQAELCASCRPGSSTTLKLWLCLQALQECQGRASAPLSSSGCHAGQAVCEPQARQQHRAALSSCG